LAVEIRDDDDIFRAVGTMDGVGSILEVWILIFVLREKKTEKRCSREVGRKVDGTLSARDGPEGEILVGLG